MTVADTNTRPLSPIKIDLIILDQLMPDGRGTDLLGAMANEDDLQKPRVIMSSCVADPSNAAWEELRKRLPTISQLLIHAYVQKPYSLSMMDAMINLLFSAMGQKPSESKEVIGGDYHSVTPLYPYAKVESK